MSAETLDTAPLSRNFHGHLQQKERKSATRQVLLWGLRIL